MFCGNICTQLILLLLVKSTLCVPLLDKYLTCFLIAVLFTVYLLSTGKCFCDHLVQFHVLNAVLFQKCLSLTVFFRYANSSLIKYMEKHKVKPDSKVFLLVGTT